MANKNEYPGFPKTYVKGDLGRVANNPTDAVNLEHRGFKVSEDIKEADSKPADQTDAQKAEAAKKAAEATRRAGNQSN